MDEPKPMRELTRIRKERDLSQQGLADASGVNKATINQIERGRRSPNLETLEKLAGALGVEVADLLPKAQASLPLLPLDSPVDGAAPDDERSLHYLRHFRAFIHALARRLEEELPKSRREVAPFYEALVDTLGQGVLEPPWQVGPKEAIGLELLSGGLQRLHEVAAKAGKGEERAGERGAATDEERAHYLHIFRAFIDEYVQRWEQKPPQTLEETTPFSNALIAVLGEGVLEPPWQAGPKELDELDRLSDGLGRLNEVAAKVNREKRAEEQEAS